MALRLKIDLHLHSAEDVSEIIAGHTELIPAKQLIDMAVAKRYDALSFTHHGMLFQNREILYYAQKKGLLLIPGVEAFIEQRHVILINFTKNVFINTFDDLRKYKNDNMLVIAPHPYYTAGISLGHLLEKHIDLFDAIEYCHYYYGPFNFNRKAVRIARKHQLPLIGNSDTHHPMQFGTTYSYVYAEARSIPAIIRAIKAGQVEYVSHPLTFFHFYRETYWILEKLPYELRMRMRHILRGTSRRIMNRAISLHRRIKNAGLP